MQSFSSEALRLKTKFSQLLLVFAQCILADKMFISAGTVDRPGWLRERGSGKPCTAEVSFKQVLQMYRRFACFGATA